ncbi:MAG: ABC transporter permease [Acidobacteria bacterium]|nr:ABC transporter permease [Acidobacteriota bacterium]
MRLSQIATGNLRRRKGRAAFLMLGFTMGIGTVVALYTLSTAIKEEIGHQLDQFGANIVIVPRANTLALNYGGISVPGVSFDVGQLKAADVERIKSIPYKNRLSVVAPKLIGVTSVEGRECLLVGVRFPEELSMKKWWNLVGRRPTGIDEVILGYEIASQLGVIDLQGPTMPAMGDDHRAHAATAVSKPGLLRSEIVIAGRKFGIAGILNETGGREDQMIFADLERVQEVMDKPDELSLVEVSALCKDCPIDDIVAQIQEQLPTAKVAALQQAVRARTQTVDRLNRFSVAIAVIVLVIGGLLIMSTLMASVIERTREIGVLRAVGFRKRHIVELLLIEVGLLSVVGGLLGWLAGTGASAIAVRHFTNSVTTVRPSLLLAGGCVAMALLLGMVACIFPARRAAALDPLEALRHI